MKVLKISAFVCIAVISGYSLAKDGSSSSGTLMYIENKTGDNMAGGLGETQGKLIGGLAKAKIDLKARAGVVRARVTSNTDTMIYQYTGDNIAIMGADAGVVDACNRDKCDD